MEITNSAGNLPNGNGEYQADFSFYNRFACLNTKFQKGRKAMDLYLSKWINSALNCVAYSFFGGVSSDHRIASVKILCRNKKQTDKVSQYDCFSLANRDIRNLYALTVRKKFDNIVNLMFHCGE